ncbi:MAG: hypothetical protein AB7D42_04315, partial [Candidatus Methanomethylophilaceae archaeon]
MPLYTVRCVMHGAVCKGFGKTTALLPIAFAAVSLVFIAVPCGYILERPVFTSSVIMVLAAARAAVVSRMEGAGEEHAVRDTNEGRGPKGQPMFFAVWTLISYWTDATAGRSANRFKSNEVVARRDYNGTAASPARKVRG